MATTVVQAPMTVSLSEQVTVNGKEYGNSVPYTITSIQKIDQRIMTITSAAEMNVIEFVAPGTPEGPGKFAQANVAFIRIKNLDDTNFVRIRMIDTGGETFDIKLEAKGVFIIHSNNIRANVTGAAFAAPFSRADFIAAQADTANVDIEYFVALL